MVAEDGGGGKLRPAGIVFGGDWEREAGPKPDVPGPIIANSQNNIKRALRLLDVQLSHDLLKESPLLDGRPLEDSAVNDLWLEVDTKFKFRPGREFFFTVVEHVARANKFHPVLDYLKGLEWDRKPRLGNWLCSHLHAPDTPFVKAVGEILLLAAVRRIKHPGTKFDELVILESSQGSGKSTAIRNLAVKDDWYCDGLQLAAGSKQVIELTSGFWLVEAPELQGLRQSDWDKLKALLSRQVDVARLSYARHAANRPRQFVPIGSTNGDRYLSDPTGNRRFWPVRLADQQIDQDKLVRERDMLWAEAVELEARGYSIRLPEDLWGAAREAQEERQREEPMQLALEAALGDITEGRIAADTVWELVGISDASKRHPYQWLKMKGAMERLGWERPKDKGRMEIDGNTVQGFRKGMTWQGAPHLPVVVAIDGKAHARQELQPLVPSATQSECHDPHGPQDVAAPSADTQGKKNGGFSWS